MSLIIGGAKFYLLVCCFFFYCCGDLRYLHSFPTRRSSDLRIVDVGGGHGALLAGLLAVNPKARRSEEHTSELQSHSDLVCRLLLEKKTCSAPRAPDAEAAPT